MRASSQRAPSCGLSVANPNTLTLTLDLALALTLILTLTLTLTLTLILTLTLTPQEPFARRRPDLDVSSVKVS